MTKLSDAIREGAKLRPQAIRDLFSHRTSQGFLSGSKVGSCALGAACEALNLVHAPVDSDAFNWGSATQSWAVFDKLLAYYPGLRKRDGFLITCPVCSAQRSTLENMIAELNDSHGWSREAIADWLVASGNDLENVEETNNVRVG